MKKETMEEFLARGGVIDKIVDTTSAYRKKFSWCGRFVSHTNRANLKEHLKAYEEISKTKLKESKQGEIK